VDAGEEIACGFVVARGDSPELLELGEEVLDQVPGLAWFKYGLQLEPS